MWDEDSFDTQSFSTESWLFDLVQEVVRRVKRLFIQMKADTLYVKSNVLERWVTKRG